MTCTCTICSQIFEPFGPVELVQLPLDIETSQCKGFGFVQVSDYFPLVVQKTLRCFFVLIYLFSMFIVCSSRTCKSSSKFEWEVGHCWSNYQGRICFGNGILIPKYPEMHDFEIVACQLYLIVLLRIYVVEQMQKLIWFCDFMQVSSVTDHVGSQEAGAKSADFDDDDGGGLVSEQFNMCLFGPFESSKYYF